LYETDNKKNLREEARKIAKKLGKKKELASFYLLVARMPEINRETNSE